jgi:hypothetical protein
MITVQQLEELRATLVRAQRAENACVRKLNAVLVASPTDRTTFPQLAARCHAARVRSVAAYEAWSAAVERFGAQGAATSVGRDVDAPSNHAS